jgi:hypothetical protein
MTDVQVIELDVTGLSPAEIDDIQTHVKSKQPGPETYFSPEHGWTCFHCGGTFYTVEGAKLHFGSLPAELPLCRKMAAELETLCAALAAAQAGAPKYPDDWQLVGRERDSLRAQGFAAGIKAAEEIARNHVGEIARKIADAIRALRPVAPAERPCPVCGGSGFSGHGTGYDDVCSECGGQRYLPPPSASEPAGVPSEEDRLVTIKLPHGYASAIEFAKDCGFELVGERSFYVKRDR